MKNIFILALLLPLVTATSPIVLDTYQTPTNPSSVEYALINAVVNDVDNDVVWVKLYYSYDSNHYNSKHMDLSGRNTWVTSMPPIDKKVEARYYIIVRDQEGNEVRSSEETFWFDDSNEQQEIFITYQEPVRQIYNGKTYATKRYIYKDSYYTDRSYGYYDDYNYRRYKYNQIKYPKQGKEYFYSHVGPSYYHHYSDYRPRYEYYRPYVRNKYSYAYHYYGSYVW